MIRPQMTCSLDLFKSASEKPSWVNAHEALSHIGHMSSPGFSIKRTGRVTWALSLANGPWHWEVVPSSSWNRHSIPSGQPEKMPLHGASEGRHLRWSLITRLIEPRIPCTEGLPLKILEMLGIKLGPSACPTLLLGPKPPPFSFLQEQFYSCCSTLPFTRFYSTHNCRAQGQDCSPRGAVTA